MQAEEQPAEAAGQGSKAASKRARKRAAKQQAASSPLNEQLINTTAQPHAVAADQDQTLSINTTTPDALQMCTACGSKPR